MRVSKIIVLLSAVLLLLGTTSCIDFLNEIKINKDKSGTVFLGLEMNAIAGLMITESDKVSPKIKEYIIHFPSESAELIKNIEGITNIESFTQPAQGRIGISFNFKNQKALNKAYYKLLEMDYKWYSPSFVIIKKHKVKIRNATPYIKDYYETYGDNLGDNSVVNYLHYKTVVHVPNSISKFNEESGSISQDKRVFITRISGKEILELDANSGFSFKY